MAEATSSTTPILCSPSGGKTKTEDKDPFKPMGSLTFLIDNFREFSNSPPGKDSMRHCDAKVSVRGLTFGLAVFSDRCILEDDATREDMCMKVIVNCENVSGCNVEGDGSWSCLASMTARIRTLFATGKDELYESTHRFFSSKNESSLEWNKPKLRFDVLLDPKRGLYNEKDNTLELIAEISADVPVGVMELSQMDTIKVNEKTVFFNKNQLALYSHYFYNMFYNGQYRDGQSGDYEVKIKAPATVKHFKRMLDTMYPMNRPLDDDCIEGVLHLTNIFSMTVVEAKCLEFLTEKSRKSALFKYRMANKYGYTDLKDHALDNLKITDFKGEMFKDNMAEYVQLGPDAAKTFKSHYDAQFTRNPAAGFSPFAWFDQLKWMFRQTFHRVLPKMDTIQVNEQVVFFNKNLLAMHSPYFNSLFYNGQFDEGKSGVYEVKIEAPATVEHFKRMLDTMYPENKPLDDDCLEGVLHLANRFLVAHVEAKCLEFLTAKSTKSAMFKYRVADKYGYTALKNHVLDNLKVADFKDKMFKENMDEYVQLRPDALEAFMARYDALFPPKPAV